MSNVNELEQLIAHELTVETHARMDHYFWCGSALAYESCSKLENHRAEGRTFADEMRLKANADWYGDTRNEDAPGSPLSSMETAQQPLTVGCECEGFFLAPLQLPPGPDWCRCGHERADHDDGHGPCTREAVMLG